MGIIITKLITHVRNQRKKVNQAVPVTKHSAQPTLMSIVYFLLSVVYDSK